jgi:uncharacterized SAM-binding protein YcdF (DUF218 family)
MQIGHPSRCDGPLGPNTLYLPPTPAGRRWAVRAVQLAALLLFCDLAASLAYLFTAVSMNPERPGARWEATVVLFSDFDAGGGIDAETRRRLNAALDLYRREAVPLIICSGGARPSTGRYGSVSMRQHLIERGVPADRVLAECRSNHTRSNVREAGQALQRMGVSRAVLVSSPVHLPRLRYLASGESGIAFDLAAYRLKDSEPPIHWQSLYWQLHHEFAARLAHIVLPGETLDLWIDRIRA